MSEIDITEADDRAISIYLNFVLYAVTGCLAQADALLNRYRLPICIIADGMRRHVGFPTSWLDQKLHRGLLVEPDEIKDGKLSLISDPFTFASFTEDPMVAAYFACRRTYISGLVVIQRPMVVGQIMTYSPVDAQILFHWTWRDTLPFVQCAISHPHIDASQFIYSMATQKEVIITNQDQDGQLIRDRTTVDVQPYDQAHDPAELDERFLPPQFRRKIGLGQENDAYKPPTICVIVHSTIMGRDIIAWAFNYDTCNKWIDKRTAGDPAQPGSVRYESYNIVEVPHIDDAPKG